MYGFLLALRSAWSAFDWWARGNTAAAKHSLWVAGVQFAQGRYPTTAEYKAYSKRLLERSKK